MKSNESMSIFLVDDDRFCLEMYKQVLSNLGYKNATCFENSSDCLNSIMLQPDVIFLDYHMDNLNGIDILKKIKRFNPNIIVLFISGQEDLQVAVNALKYGAFDYIVKKDFNEVRIGNAMDKIIVFKDMLKKNSRKGFFKRVISFF
jgi:DNA-binding NtrC family response regulator